MGINNDKLAQTAPFFPFHAQIGVARKAKKGVIFLPASDLREDPERGTLIAYQEGDETRWGEPPAGCYPVREGSVPPDHLLDVVVSVIGAAPRPGPVGLDGKERVDVAELAELWRGTTDDLARLFNR